MLITWTIGLVSSVATELDFAVSFLWAESFTCLLRLLFGCATSEAADGVGSGERPLLAGAFLVELDLAPTESGFVIRVPSFNITRILRRI
jgi:hypothetical protein